MIAPLESDPEAARAIVWGGKAYCDGCHLERRNYEAETGDRLPAGACFKNRRGPCRYPRPDVWSSVQALLDVWRDTPKRLQVGWDGSVPPVDLHQVMAVADAHGEVWDSELVQRLAVIEAFWMVQEIRKRPKGK